MSDRAGSEQDSELVDGKPSLPNVLQRTWLEVSRAMRGNRQHTARIITMRQNMMAADNSLDSEAGATQGRDHLPPVHGQEDVGSCSDCDFPHHRGAVGRYRKPVIDPIFEDCADGFFGMADGFRLAIPFGDHLWKSRTP